MSLDLSGLDAPTAPADRAARAPLRRFEEDPENPRTEFEGPEFDSFVADIKQRGILQPLVVTKTAHGKLRIRFGARRFRAAAILKLDYIPYVVVDDERQLDSYAQVSENEQRKNLEPLELARFIARRVQAGEAKGFVAEKLGVPAHDVTYLLSMLDAPDFICELYTSGKCRSPQFLYRLRRLFEKHPELVRNRVEALGPITHADLDSITAEIEGPKEQTKKAPLDADADPPTAQAASAPASKVAPPAHQPRIEPSPRAAKESDRIRKPLLLGRHDERDVMLVLSKRPSSGGQIFVRYEDNGAEAEVPFSAVTLSLLTESAT